jgi:hypothetical protein
VLVQLRAGRQRRGATHVTRITARLDMHELRNERPEGNRFGCQRLCSGTRGEAEGAHGLHHGTSTRAARARGFQNVLTQLSV